MPPRQQVTPAQRARIEEQRERYRELLEELRTIMPGVQVLLGFLLIAPFSSRFDEVDTLGVWSFVVALLAAALATVVLLTPAAYHRMKPGSDREERVAVSIGIQMIGMVLLALATVVAVFVVARFLLGTAAGVVAAALVTCVAVGLWWVLPSRRGAPRK